MAPRIVVTEQARSEEGRLGIDLIDMVHSVIKYVPGSDLMGISEIIFTDLPTRKGQNSRALASYFKKYGTHQAFIEVYIKNLFWKTNSSHYFSLILPIQLRILAEAIFHEVGHHVRQMRSHGVGNVKNESFADAYANRLLASYLIDNASAIDCCVKRLENSATEFDLSLEKIQKVKQGWEKERETMLMSGKE
jgi:hypothetical protein